MAEGIRISTLTSQEQVRKSMQTSQGDLGRVTKQITSAKKSDDFIGLAKETPTENYLSIRNTLTTISTSSKNNALLANKIEAMETAVSGLKELASDVKLLLQQTRDPVSGNNVDTVALAKNYLLDIKHYLSAEFNGQKLFAGSRMDVRPVGDIANVSNIVGSAPTANYYQGDDAIIQSRISDESIVEYGITANNPTFQKLIASLHQLIDGKVNNDPSKYTQAIAWADESNVELSAMISRVGSNAQKVDSELKKAQDSVLKLKELVANIEDTDTAEAMTELMAIQTQLQAAYMLLVRINSTSLADYIK